MANNYLKQFIKLKIKSNLIISYLYKLNIKTNFNCVKSNLITNKKFKLNNKDI